jgi:hypothetical protein
MNACGWLINDRNEIKLLFESIMMIVLGFRKEKCGDLAKI